LELLKEVDTGAAPGYFRRQYSIGPASLPGGDVRAADNERMEDMEQNRAAQLMAKGYV